MKVSIVVLEMNEIQGMKVVMPRIKKEWYDELIIVDGDSTDGSIEYAKQNNYEIFIQKEKGFGPALKEAMERVTGDIIIIFAPDGSFIPEIIPKMVEKIEDGYDVVNVTRYGYGAKSYDDNIFSAVGNSIFTKLANILFNYKLTDFLYMYIAFKKEALSDLEMINVSEMPWGQILLLRAIKRNLKIIEIPSDEPVRVGGEGKVNKLLAAYKLVIMLIKERFIK